MKFMKKEIIRKIALWLIFAMMFGFVQIPAKQVSAQETVVGEGILITDYVNMGINSEMTGGSAGKIYEGEVLDLYERILMSSGKYCWYVRSHTLNVKGYVSERFLSVTLFSDNTGKEVPQEYDAELINITDFYNMGINANLTGGSAGTIYPGEKFKIIRTETSTISFGYCYYVYALNAGLYGYVSPRYVGFVSPTTPPPTDTPTPTPTNTPTPTPTNTPTPTVTPTPTNTPTRMPKPTETPAPTNTPTPALKVTAPPTPTPVITTGEIDLPPLPIKYGKTTDWVNLGVDNNFMYGTTGRVETGDLLDIYIEETNARGTKCYYAYAQNAKIYGWISSKYVEIIPSPGSGEDEGSISYNYKNKSDFYHVTTKTTTYADGKTEKGTYDELHSYDRVGGICTKCGKEYVYPIEGEYITKVSYALRIDRKSSSKCVLDKNGDKVVIPKEAKITVQEVKWNSVDNFWGTVTWDGYTGYIWMGQVRKELLLNIQLMKQGDSRWGNEKIGKSGKTIRQIGCTLTCLAMAESYRTNTTITPSKMKSQLKFTDSGSLYWPSNYQKYSGADYLGKIKELLDSGKPVILCGARNKGSDHWVLVIGYRNLGTIASEYLINDPGSVNRENLQEFFDTYRYDCLRYYK